MIDKKYLLINTDGYDINYRTFNSFEEAATEMEKAYKSHKPDYLEEEYADLTYIGENNASVYCNGEDVYLWEIITVEFNLSEDDRDNIYRQIWQKTSLKTLKAMPFQKAWSFLKNRQVKLPISTSVVGTIAMRDTGRISSPSLIK